MRFGWLAAAAAMVLGAGQANAARYYTFEVSGAAKLPGYTIPDILTVPDRLYNSVSTYVFDTFSTSGATLFGSGGDGFAGILFLDPASSLAPYISTSPMPAGPLFSFSFAASGVQIGETLSDLAVSDTSFVYRIRPDGRYTTTIDTDVGQIYRVRARTSDVTPAALGARDVVTVTPVPELSAWAMMIGGLFFMGAALRHRRSKSTQTV